MKKWHTLFSSILSFLGGFVLSANVESFGIAHFIAVFLILLGGVFTGLDIADE